MGRKAGLETTFPKLIMLRQFGTVTCTGGWSTIGAMILACFQGSQLQLSRPNAPIYGSLIRPNLGYGYASATGCTMDAVQGSGRCQ